MRNLEWIPLANPPYLAYDLGIMFEQHFWFEIRHKHGIYKEEGNNSFLWSIPVNKKTDFEKSCNELKIDITEIDLNEIYNEYLKENTIYKPSAQENIPIENQVDICDKSFTHIICGPGTTQIFLEHNIGEKDNIKLYINSNEEGRHHIPHCHVKYNNYENYCVLSLVDYQKIEPDGKTKNAVVCKAQSILADNIQLARKKWNEINSLLKFKICNGNYTSEYQ